LNYLSSWVLWVRIPLKQGELDTTLCDKACQWHVTGRWFSPVSSTNKTDRDDIRLRLRNTTKMSYYCTWSRLFFQWLSDYPRWLIFSIINVLIGDSNYWFYNPSWLLQSSAFNYLSTLLILFFCIKIYKDTRCQI
jgi:hypothetical protein